MRVLAVLLAMAALLGNASEAQHQLGSGSFGGFGIRLLIGLQQMLARVVCRWESRCTVHALNNCLRDLEKTSQLVVTFTECYTFVPEILRIYPGTGGRVVTAAVQQMKQCLREKNDQADEFLDCVTLR
ncbi:uncharacterized protein [Panulirus ornatus]|uniref:uncharacterized protein n=1 Tax=Panulirus ornatus TaxID=150431 RepID=UPI003A870EFD